MPSVNHSKIETMMDSKVKKNSFRKGSMQILYTIKWCNCISY